MKPFICLDLEQSSLSGDNVGAGETEVSRCPTRSEEMVNTQKSFAAEIFEGDRNIKFHRGNAVSQPPGSTLEHCLKGSRTRRIEVFPFRCVDELSLLLLRFEARLLPSLIYHK